jgi:DNA-binding winged helix-turn-helix (wHTH) protein/Tfp pilus assembly protein PilF/TolB-like protein
MNTQEKQHLYEFGPFHLDTEEGQLLRDGEPVPLTYKAFEMLRVLVENSGHVVAKDDFLKKIWPETFIEEGILTVNIANLRKALGEDRSAHQYIETVPRRGYRFVARVREVQHISADLAVPSNTPVIIEDETTAADKSGGVAPTDQKKGPTENRSSREVKWWLRPNSWAVGLMMIVVAVALSYFWIWNKPNPIGPLAVRSIAVLPFKPLVLESRDEALELGMADTLITKLSTIRQVVVRPLSSVRKYAGIDQDAIAAGRELHVDAVLDASLQRDGDRRIRVTARLLRVSDGSAIWTDKFDEQFVSIFLAQDVIAERVAGVLTQRLTGEVKRQLAKHHTDSPEAYELYLKARFFSQRASAEGFKKGLQFFQQAIEKDPAYALAHAGLARSYIQLGTRGLLSPEVSWQKIAESAARRAVEIDDTLAEAHVALGFAIMHDWHFSAAEAEFKRALELDPSSVDACRSYSHFLWMVGRFDEAIANAERAREIDPVSVVANSGLAKALLEAGQYDQAIEQFKQALETDPNFVPALASLAGAYAAKGMYEEAIVECKKAIAVDNSPQRRGQLTQLGQIYAQSGKKEEARKVLDDLKEHAKKQYLPPFNFAVLYEALGDKDQAMAWLEKAYLERDIALIPLRRRGFDSLRSDPRFVDLLRRIEAASH